MDGSVVRHPIANGVHESSRLQHSAESGSEDAGHHAPLTGSSTPQVDVPQALAEKLLQGWTMTNSLCPRCSLSFLEYPNASNVSCEPCHLSRSQVDTCHAGVPTF
jgi:hypothetical protein